MNLLQTNSFNSAFGQKSHQRQKRPKLSFESLGDLASNAETKFDNYDEEKDDELNKKREAERESRDEVSDPLLKAGQSRRIWNELYKVVDSSDVLIHVLDARDPMGTRCENIEKFLRHERPTKHLVYVINKCDLVPSWVTVRPSLFSLSDLKILIHRVDRPATSNFLHHWLPPLHSTLLFIIPSEKAPSLLSSVSLPICTRTESRSALDLLVQFFFLFILYSSSFLRNNSHPSTI